MKTRRRHSADRDSSRRAGRRLVVVPEQPAAAADPVWQCRYPHRQHELPRWRWLASLTVDEGDSIRAGQTLGELDRAPYENALLQAQANVSTARRSMT